MEVVNPSMMVSRLDLVVLDSAAAGIDFHPGGTRGGHNPPGRAWSPRHAQVGCAPPGAPSSTSLAQHVSSGLEKFSKKFCCI